MTDDDIYVLIEEKKTDPFRSMLLRKPKREDVYVNSKTLHYECILAISGKYEANYFRKVTHTISVSKNVNEIVFGNGVFPIRSKSDFHKKISGKLGKNKIDLPLEEHVFVESKGKYFFDHGGREIKFPFKINSKAIENYPFRILEKNEPAVVSSKLSDDDLITKLSSRLKPEFEDEIRDLADETVVEEVTEIYVPVYVAKLIGPKKKTATMRIDAVRSKIL